MRKASLATALILLGAPHLMPASAQTGAVPPPPPPPIPREEEVPEPEVTIRPIPGGTVQEFRYNGQLYMVRVIPSRGPPYYLVDADGDGQLETRTSGLEPRFVIPAWALYRW